MGNSTLKVNQHTTCFIQVSLDMFRPDVGALSLGLADAYAIGS